MGNIIENDFGDMPNFFNRKDDRITYNDQRMLEAQSVISPVQQLTVRDKVRIAYAHYVLGLSSFAISKTVGMDEIIIKDIIIAFAIALTPVEKGNRT